jgi:hypothetical protein
MADGEWDTIPTSEIERLMAIGHDYHKKIIKGCPKCRERITPKPFRMTQVNSDNDQPQREGRPKWWSYWPDE